MGSAILCKTHCPGLNAVSAIRSIPFGKGTANGPWDNLSACMEIAFA